MVNNRSNIVERRLYEYTLYAVCSPLHVVESSVSHEELALHVAKLFNVDLDEHEQKYMQVIQTEPCSVVLMVDVKRARNLPAEDQNGFSDPYCKISIAYAPNNQNRSHNSLVSLSSAASSSISTNRPKRSPSLFSCFIKQSQTHKSKALKSQGKSTKSSRRGSLERSSELVSRAKVIKTVTRRTQVQHRTVNPEWNEHFEFDIENLQDQYLIITVYDSDIGEESGLGTVVREKRGVEKTFRGLCLFLQSGQIEDDFLGQVKLLVKSLAITEREQWFPLTDKRDSISHNNRQRGEILLGLKVHFKLYEETRRMLRHLYTVSKSHTNDDKSTKERRKMTKGTVLEFRRRHATSYQQQRSSSIISRASIFRRNFRNSNQTRSYSIEDNLERDLSKSDTCLTPAVDNGLPLLIEEYHQLTRIVMLHELEDTRESTNKDPNSSNGLPVSWNGALHELSHHVLSQFRILYNISSLSESFIQLLVIMELRGSDDYGLFISQGIIQAYLKIFIQQIEQRASSSDLDLTDYEKEIFQEIFLAFLGHYKKRTHNDVLWFLPSQENLSNIETTFDIINTLFGLKLCSNEATYRKEFEDTIRHRLHADIDDLLPVQQFTTTDTNDSPLNSARDLLEFVKKLTVSMSIIKEYQAIFAKYNINYIATCFFETKSAGDRLTDLTKDLLKGMTDYFHTFSKPNVRARTTIYDPNLIQSSSTLLNLYICLQTINNAIQSNLEERYWRMNIFKFKLAEFSQWFSPIMTFLLEGFVAQIRQAMERAVEDDNDLIADTMDEHIHHSQSSIAATSLCIKICQEWDSIQYPDPEIRYTAVVKLTNTICEQCQQYARRIAHKLLENKYFIELDRTKSFNVSKKLCLFVNDIEYVKRRVLSSLPKLLNFTTVIDRIVEFHDTNGFRKIEKTLEHLITTAENEMNEAIRIIFDHVAKLFYESLKSKISNYYRDERLKKANCMEDIHLYIDREILQKLYLGLEQVQYSRVATAIRMKALQCFRELLPSQEPPDFYERVLKSFDDLATYFEAVCQEVLSESSPPCEDIKSFQRTLRRYSSSTEELMLRYFKEINRINSLQQPDVSMNNGDIAFRTAYETINDLITIYVLILSCQGLPKMDYIGASDPYVVLELLPVSLYQNRAKVQRTVTVKRTLNPEYNALFQWHRLPSNVVHISGAVLRLSVWDQDMVVDDFIGEYFVPLTSIEPLGNRATLRDVPVTKARLKRPHRNYQPQEFNLILNRKEFDEQAAQFIQQRKRVMQSGSTSDGGSVISEDRKSSGSYANAAIRSLLCLLPINIGSGLHWTASDRSDFDGDEEEI